MPRSLGCAGYAAVDLASPSDMDAKLAALGTFDLIVLTEVIEHLPIHPRRPHRARASPARARRAPST